MWEWPTRGHRASDVLDSGPRTRGTERKMYQFSDGTEGDVYRCILKAVSANPPQLSFSYEEIQARVQIVLPNGEFFDISEIKLLQNKLLGVRETHRLVITIEPEKWKMGKVLGKV